MTRLDGRAGNQLRPLRLQTSVLERADGSATFQHDKTVVLAAVYGPTDINQRKEILDRAYVEVILSPSEGRDLSPEQREWTLTLRQLLTDAILVTRHPRTEIRIVLQIIYDDGSLFSALVNAACSALLDAGVSMKGTIWASCVAIRAPETGDNGEEVVEEEKILLDPTKAEEESSQGTVTIACIPAQGQDKPFNTIFSSGALGKEDLCLGIDQAHAVIPAIQSFVSQALRKSIRATK